MLSHEEALSIAVRAFYATEHEGKRVPDGMYFGVDVSDEANVIAFKWTLDDLSETTKLDLNQDEQLTRDMAAATGRVMAAQCIAKAQAAGAYDG